MIYITGDTHGEYDRFFTNRFPQQKKLTKNDYVIICGDFGIWNGSSSENKNFDWLDERPFTTLFVDGNHENYDMLKKIPVEQWHGGEVQFIRPSVIHLMRGNLYDIDGKKFFTMGGAKSHDISDGILDPKAPNFRKRKAFLNRNGRYMYRIKGVSWWEEELPSDEEYEKALKTLEECGWSVDYIITHCAPTGVVTAQLNLDDCNKLTDFLEDISIKCKFDYWFFGHYHGNKMLGDGFYLLFENIIPLPEKKLGYSK